MLLQRLHHYPLRHLQPIVQILQILDLVADFRFRDGEFLGGDGEEGAVEIVDAVDEVFGEAGDGEVAGGADVAFGAVLEVAEVGDGAEVFVLRVYSRLVVVFRGRLGMGVWAVAGRFTFKSIISLFFASSSFFSGSSGVSTASLPNITSLLSAAEARVASDPVSGVVEYHFGRKAREVGIAGIRRGEGGYLGGSVERARGSLELRARDCRSSDR